MSNLDFDSNKIKKKWKELYTEKDKIISFIDNFDTSNSKFASKVYLEESKKKQNIDRNLSSSGENITNNSNGAVEGDILEKEENQNNDSELKKDDQEEIIPIEPKFNLEQVELIKKEAEELGKKHGYIEGKKHGYEQGHSKGLIEGEVKGVKKGKIDALEEAQNKANEKVEIVLNELKQLFESAKKEFNKTEIIENVSRLSLHISETICRGLHSKNPDQLMGLIKFNLSKIMPDDNKLVTVFLSKNDFDNYGSIIQKKLSYKISPHSETSNGVIRIKVDEYQYEDNFNNNLLAIAKDILSKESYEKYQEEKIKNTEQLNKILSNEFDNESLNKRTLDEQSNIDDKPQTNEGVDEIKNKDNNNLNENKAILEENNRTLNEQSNIDDKPQTNEGVVEIKNEDNHYLDENKFILKENAQGLNLETEKDNKFESNEVDDISISSDNSSVISADQNAEVDINNENNIGNKPEKIKENLNSIISENDNNKS